jgi:hypothetical protein
MIHYFIHICHLQGCTIVTLVDIFVNVLDSLDSGTDLYVDMTVILCGQPRIVGNNMTVVKCVTSGVGVGPAIVWPGIFRISVSTKTGCGAKFLGEMLAALTIDHAGCSEVLRTTGTMDHTLCDGLIKHGLSFRVRDLGRNERVDMRNITNLELLPQEDEEMDMRQTPLLKLYGEDKSKNTSKQAILYVLEHGLHLLGKDTCHNIRTISSGLMSFPLIWIIVIGLIREEVVLDLWPVGIGSHCDEEVWLATVTCNGH